MPQRQSNTTRVEGGPQGSDAYVVVKRMTVDESMAFRKLFLSIKDKDVEEQEALSRKSLADLLVEWNWVNGDGSPMPQPNAEVIGVLFDTELQWLFEAVTGATTDQKKDLKPLPTT